MGVVAQNLMEPAVLGLAQLTTGFFCIKSNNVSLVTLVIIGHSQREAVSPWLSALAEEIGMVTFFSNSAPTVVLIVEDDVLLRWQAAELVTDLGYVAIEVPNADTAIAVLEERDDIRIVFTDIRMPGSMDGLKLAHAIRHRWPPLELILTSGDCMPSADDLPARSRFFPKPYDMDELMETLKSLASA